MKHTRDTSRRTSRTRGLLASAVAVALGATGLVALATTASSTPAPKYFVCKYVGTPGENERLQDGGNPISVNGNAINADPIVVGSYFADQHGRSFVLAEDVGQADPSPSECPPGDPIDEQPDTVPVDPAVFTAPTCDAPGTLVGVDTQGYEWVRTGPDTAAVLTAHAIGEVTLTGTTVFGPYDLTQLSGEACLSETPIIPQAPVVPTVKQATLAETGAPLLGLLGLAGSLSLIGGGLLNAGRLLRIRH